MQQHQFSTNSTVCPVAGAGVHPSPRNRAGNRVIIDFVRCSILCVGMTLSLLLAGAHARADADGLFIGGAVQYGQVDEDFNIDNIEDIEAVFDDKDVGFNVGLGWRFNKWLAVDVGYWDLGTFKSDQLQTGDKIDLDTTSFTVGGIFSVPLWILDVYARGGAAFWDVDSSELDNDGSDPYYGVGVAFNFFGSIDFYLEALRFDLETDIDTVSLGARFTF